MRCKACDAVMTTEEMVVRPETGEFEDLCYTCRVASKLGEDDDNDYDVEVEVGLIREKYRESFTEE